MSLLVSSRQELAKTAVPSYHLYVKLGELQARVGQNSCTFLSLIAMIGELQ